MCYKQWIYFRRDTLIWHLTKRVWFTGPSVPEDIYLLYTSAVAINSTAVLFVGANIPYGCCHRIFINSARLIYARLNLGMLTKPSANNLDTA